MADVGPCGPSVCMTMKRSRKVPVNVPKKRNRLRDFAGVLACHHRGFGGANRFEHGMNRLTPRVRQAKAFHSAILGDGDLLDETFTGCVDHRLR